MKNTWKAVGLAVCLSLIYAVLPSAARAAAASCVWTETDWAGNVVIYDGCGPGFSISDEFGVTTWQPDGTLTFHAW